MDESYIKLFRKFKKWEWYDDINTKVLFLHLLLSVNYEDKKWHGETIRKGELITSQKKLSKETRLSRQQIRLSLDKLKTTSEITYKTTNKYTIITLVNWEKYQCNDKKTTNKTTSNLTIEQPSSNQQATTTKEYKEYKEYKEINNIYIYIEQQMGRTLSPYDYETIEKWLKIYSENEIKKAFEIANNNNARTMNYVKSVLFLAFY